MSGREDEIIISVLLLLLLLLYTRRTMMQSSGNVIRNGFLVHVKGSNLFVQSIHHISTFSGSMVERVYGCEVHYIHVDSQLVLVSFQVLEQILGYM